MKKDYIKPEIRFEEFEIEIPMLLDVSTGKFDEEDGTQGGLGAKDRENDAEWGDLW